VRNPARLVEPGTCGEVPLGRELRAWVVSGHEAGPIVWLWAPGGDGDPSMAQALGELRDELSPEALAGAVGLLIDGPPPPLDGEQYGWAAPVRAIADGAAAIVLCSSLPSGYEATPHATLDLADRAARKVARALGAPFAAPPVLTPPLDRKILSAPTVSWIDGEAERLSRPVVDRTVAALRSLLGSLGMTGDESREPPLRVVLKSIATVEAPGAGLVEPAAQPGALVRAGEPAAFFGRPGLRTRSALLSPATGVVLFARSGLVPPGPVMGIGKLRRALPRLTEEPASMSPAQLELGWCERVQLPELGLRLKAKIDTGARTSALHVLSMEPLDERRLSIEIPAGRGRRRTEVEVIEWTTVRDSGGHAERRPVVETLLKLGALERRVRVSLTNRGDMLFPMLVGRTALGAGVRVHPTRRWLLG
jgi:hypothetical protein